MGKDIEKKLKAVESYFGNVDFYNYKENVTEKGHNCRYAFYTKNGHLVFGITQETYEEYQEEIEEIKQKALAKAEKKIIKSSWIVKALTDSIIQEVGLDFSTGIRYYTLSTRVPKDIWNAISAHFEYLSGDDLDDDTDFGFGGKYRGWVTRQQGAEIVKEILKEKAKDLASQNHLEVADEILKEREEIEKAQIEEEKEKEKKKRILEEVNKAFKNAERPDPKTEAPQEAEKYQPGYEKMRVEGKKVDNPFNPPNIYGGGEWFILQEGKFIWKITNNGADGDDWRLNNVETGGAGAIGIRIKWDKEISDKILSLG